MSIGERYKLFVIKKNTFKENFSFQEYGVNLIEQDNKILVDTIKWRWSCKKICRIEMGDIITEFKIENLNRPDKKLIYPIALLLILRFWFFK